MSPWLAVTLTEGGGAPPGPEDQPGKLHRNIEPLLLRTITCLLLALLVF